MPQKPNDIFKDNAFEYEFSVQEKDTNTGQWKVVTGLADLSIWISATDGGAEVHANVKVLAAERAQSPGTYYGKIAGVLITAHVFPLADDTKRYVVGGNAAGDIKVSSERRAWNVRRIP